MLSASLDGRLLKAAYPMMASVFVCGYVEDERRILLLSDTKACFVV
jgi:hypothetical protein